MPAELLRLDLRLRRRSLVGTAVGAAAYLFVVIAAYPSFRHDTSFDQVIATNPSAAAAFGINGSITSPAGWLSSNLYANLGPLLALLLTIGYGASAIAGQNSEGLLGIVATQPLSRVRIVRAKLACLLATAAVVPVVAYAVCFTGPHFQLSPDWGRLAAVSVATTLLALDFGILALVVGALRGSRGLALGVPAAVAAATYLVSSLAAVSSTFRSIRWISPFFWAVGNGQLTTGVPWPSLTALVGVGLILAAVAVWAFLRLDVR